MDMRELADEVAELSGNRLRLDKIELRYNSVAFAFTDLENDLPYGFGVYGIGLTTLYKADAVKFAAVLLDRPDLRKFYFLRR